MTETDEKQALGPQPNQGDDDSKHMKNKAIDKVPESTITVSPEAWAREAHLNLSVFRENQNMTYDTLLKEFSSVGKLVEHIRQCEKLLAVHQTRRKLDEAINEADLITELSTYLEQVDIQKMRLELQYQRLKEENLWLAGEQANLKEKLQKLNNELKDAEAEREMRHFIYQMRRGDNEEADTKSRWIERELEEDGYIAELISPKMRGLYHLAIKYISEGRLDVAVAMCSQLLRDRVKTNELKSLDYGVINLLLGIVLRKQNRLTESNANMEDALETFEMEVGDEHPSLTCVLVQLAELNNEMKVYDEAEKYLQRAIVLKRKISGDGRDDVLKLQVDLVATLVNEGKNAEALELCESALKTLLFNYPPRDQMIADSSTKHENGGIKMTIQSNKLIGHTKLNRHTLQAVHVSRKLKRYRYIFEKRKDVSPVNSRAYLTPCGCERVQTLITG
ncbi:unnamed protein product [Calicophoron daubneyi]|uniref:Kinesin light chain n=1 Tax=Calicophoron daubneyi TaxID=300641 RepID=A0AAV2T4H3_CALDB